MLTAAITAWVVAMVLAPLAGLAAVVFKRDDVPFMDSAGGALGLLRNPGQFVRAPYARVVQVLTIASFTAGLVAIACFVIARL